MLNPWLGKISWRREWQPTPVFLPGEFQGQRSRGHSVGHNRATNTFISYTLHPASLKNIMLHYYSTIAQYGYNAEQVLFILLLKLRLSSSRNEINSASGLRVEGWGLRSVGPRSLSLQWWTNGWSLTAPIHCKPQPLLLIETLLSSVSFAFSIVTLTTYPMFVMATGSVLNTLHALSPSLQ